MASSEPFNCWSVKIMPIPADTTVTQLAQEIGLPTTRICLPKTDYAWINDFVSKEEADNFVMKMSGSWIFGATIKCVTVPPKSDRMDKRRLSRQLKASSIGSLDNIATQPQSNRDTARRPNNNSLSGMPVSLMSINASGRPNFIKDNKKLDQTCQPILGLRQLSSANNRFENINVSSTNLSSYSSAPTPTPGTPMLSESQSRLRIPSPARPRPSSVQSTAQPVVGTVKMCPQDIRCFNADCQLDHPKGWNPCQNGVQCRNYDCIAKHPPGRKGRCRNEDQCKNKNNCEFLHSTMHATVIELSDAEQNFLKKFGKKILDKIRKDPDIKDVQFENDKLQLIGNTSAITNVKSYLTAILFQQNVTITSAVRKYLEGRLLTKFLEKYHVGISFSEIKEEEAFEDASSNIATASVARKPRLEQFTQVTLCSDSEDSLAKAIRELKSYTLDIQSWILTQNESEFILKESQKEKPVQKRMSNHQLSLCIEKYLINLVQSKENSAVKINVKYIKGVYNVRVKGFKVYVNNAVSKIKNWSNDNIETEVQLPISKTMGIFLRTKASFDLKKLEKTHRIKITTMSPPKRKLADDEQDDDDHDCLKLTGSDSRINSAQVHVENFLDSLAQQEKHFDCPNWDISKSISQTLRIRLKAMTTSDDCEVIGWLKLYTPVERRDITPRITMTIVGFNQEAVDGLVEQCQTIIEGYVVWIPSKDEFRMIFTALVLKKSPSFDEFRQQYMTEIRLDRDTDTIIIPAQSKILADEIKEALLNLGEKKVRVQRLSEFIPIQPKIRRFVNKNIGSLLDEAKSQKIFVESKNAQGLTLNGPDNIVTEFKTKINAVINDIKQKCITHRLSLSSVESDFLRTNNYQLLSRIERDTNTIIRDVRVDASRHNLQANINENSSIMITVANDRGQSIVVEKGDITKAKNVDAIINAANGPLYHAGGVDKTIANAAGPAFDQECRQILVNNGGLPIPAGKAVKTTAGNLPFRCIIHAIGPQYIDGNQQERPLLFSCVMSSLKLAEIEGCRSVAMPAISSKTYGFPMTDCTNIVVRTVKQFFADYPQSKIRKVILLDLDDAACSSFARELPIDHSNSVEDDDEDMTNYELPPLTAKWCWESDIDEKINTDNDARKIELAFQQYIKTFTESQLILSPDNLKSGTIVNYSIHFRPDLKQLLTSTPNVLNSRLVCGYQMRMDTHFKRDIIRYPVDVRQQSSSIPINYHPKPLDSYSIEPEVTQEYWNIIGIMETSVAQAQSAIQAAIQSATISESFYINLNKDLDNHKKEISKIATQQSVQIEFQQHCSEQLTMILKGFKANVSEAKLSIALYAQDMLKKQVENDDELEVPEGWSEQEEECKLVEISRTDPAFIRIEKRMKETMSTIKIDKIQRVQNLRMWSHFAFRHRELKKKLRNMPNLEIEMELFHGTRHTLPSEIYNGEYGFDMTYCTAGMWGVGTYFAQDALYSCASYRYSLPNGKSQVFLAQVLTGHSHNCNSDSSIRRPPKKNESTSGQRYDSVSGTTGGSTVYIVYENRVAYPTYLITFAL
ncbi:unnamed protein product [Adineta steineri]|uniref:Poly [ADP-ribose] polymerase n=1 Tax=Adineta steineri TaxID=433720 RepID=A0A813WUJ9_9BILA|nr:unnamed protein product [Adineta steineri]CAF3855580.1 unnamed protein product [Adineta steineri]